MESPFNSIHLLKILVEYKKPLMIVALLAAVISGIFSSPYFMKPRFKSSSVIYPGNSTSYSTESLTEQLLEIFKSSAIRDTLAKQFDLYKRYQISADSPQRKTAMSKVYEERVSIDKTDFEAVSITVSDEDPVVAKKMLDSMIVQGDRLLKKLRKEKLLEVVQSYDFSRKLVRHKMDSLKAIVDSMRRVYGILDFGIQTKELYRNYYRAISSDNRGVDEMRKTIEVLKTQGYNYDFAYQESNLMRDLYISWEDQYYKSLRDYKRDVSYVNVVTPPDLPDKKHYPIRWIVVLSSVLFSLSMAIVFIITKRFWRQVNQ